MAVKQNNTEANNGAPSNVGGGNSGTTATGGAKPGGGGSGGGNTSGSGGGGAGTKTKKMSDGVGVVVDNADQPGCSGVSSTGASAKQKSGSNAGVNTGLSGAGTNSNAGGAGINGGGHLGKPGDIATILQLIELLENNQQQVAFEQELLLYHHLIVELARVQVPRHSPDELKRFKEDIAKVFTFFAKANEKRVYLFYLRVVCQLITQSGEDGSEPPSCAIAVIFQLFTAELIFEAVQSLLEHKIPDQNIRKTVRLLSEWLRICNFCQNLNLWIMAILSGLQEQHKYTLFEEIASDNIEPLFVSLIIPVLRPKVAPIVFHMLSSISQTPQVFHKVLAKIPIVMNFLKQQSTIREPHAEETKKFLQKFVDLISALMVRFYGYDDLYEPVERALKDFQPSYNYLNYANGTKTANDDSMLNTNNAKVGLVNLGNTCYMNSVLQALAMTKEFSREILLSDSKSPLLIKMQQQIALMLYSMRYELTPSRVLNATRPPGFSPGLQQDSSEFLGYLLEMLHEQEVTYRKKFLTTDDDDDDDEITDVQIDTKCIEGATANTFYKATTPPPTPSQCDKQHTTSYESKTISDESQSTNLKHAANTNTTSTAITTTTNKTTTASFTTMTASPNTHCSAATQSAGSAAIGASPTTCSMLSKLSTIEKTFTGKLATTYKCLSCGWKSRNIDSFRDLQLSFPEVKNDCASNYSVQDLIDYYCSPEKLYGDNQYFCEKCKKLSDAERYINVISAPKNLILTLKHFKYDQKYHMRAKLMHKVFHDEKVSVKVCSAETLDEIASVHYDLYAGVVHSGFSMDSGHYYTYAADATNKWYKFNDSIVTPSKSEELHNLTPPNTPYILFYQMGARSNEPLETATASMANVIKVEMPLSLKLEELPNDLRDYVNHDNFAFNEELKIRRIKNVKSALQNALKAQKNNSNNNRYNNDDDDDEQPPAAGCGGNALNINVNRFVY